MHTERTCAVREPIPDGFHGYRFPPCGLELDEHGKCRYHGAHPLNERRQQSALRVAIAAVDALISVSVAERDAVGRMRAESARETLIRGSVPTEFVDVVAETDAAIEAQP